MKVEQFVAACSSIEPDWSREVPRGFWDPGRKLIRAIRKHQAVQKKSGMIAKLQMKYWSMNHMFWSTICGAEIHLTCDIGGGFMIPHPNGIVIHPETKIGPNCLIFQQVTFGNVGTGAPEIGGHVDIGAGAKIIGKIKIGDHVQVGANAVVTKSIPEKTSVAGIPAKIIQSV